MKMRKWNKNDINKTILGEPEETKSLSSAVALNDYRPRSYNYPMCMTEFETAFREEAMKCIEKGNLDEFNASYMDARIQYVLDQSLEALRLQREQHRDLICNSIENNIRGQIAYLQHQLESVLHEKKRAQEEYRVYEKIYHKGTIFESF